MDGQTDGRTIEGNCITSLANAVANNLESIIFYMAKRLGDAMSVEFLQLAHNSSTEVNRF